MKRAFPLIFICALSSLLCFYHPHSLFYYDWALFLFVFALTCLLMFFQRGWREKNRVRSNIRRTRALFPYLNLASDAIVLFDEEGQVLAVNRAAETLFKVEKDKVVGTHLIADSAEVFWQYFAQLSKLAEQVIDQGRRQVTTVCVDNTNCQESVNLVGQPTEVLGIFAITAKDGAKSRVGKDFVANASHELRTPITIIKGFAETMNDLPEISASMLEDFVEKIVRNCHRMDNLVKNLLTLTDLDALPKAKLQDCDIVCLMDNCAHTLLSVYPNTDIEILHNQDVVLVPADPDLLELALMNLLENAAKYSVGDPKISVTIEKTEEGVDVVIKDKGKGIPAEDLDSIFERFYTVNKAHTRKLGGAGLGLSIVKTIISKHDAQISVFSELGKGTTFTLSFNTARTALV